MAYVPAGGSSSVISPQQQRTPAPASGRNEACACGSGKKFKRCCLPLQESSAPLRTAPPALAAQTASALVSGGLALKRQGRMAAALAAFRRATEVEPCSYAAHFQLGSALAQAKEWQAAAESLTRAIQLRPNSPEAISNLGAVLQSVDSHERAVTCFQQALRVNPTHTPALVNLGHSLSALGRHAEAVEVLQQAVQTDHRLADAHVNLSHSLLSSGRFDEAIHHCQCALEIQPGDVEALLNLGNAYKERGQLSLAVETYLGAIRSDATDARACINLGDTYRDAGRIDEADAAYRKALALQPESATAYSNLLYLHAFAHDLPPEDELELARGWERNMLSAQARAEARSAAGAGAGVFHTTALQDRRLRLGIVSAELGSHAVAEFLQPFLENLDRERFHLTLFPAAFRSGSRAEHLLSLADACFPLSGVSDAAAVELIRRERIDVLMDTSGHTAGNRLGIFARRAASVQCTYVGYWSTTGLTEMDWFLSDPDAPLACQRGFSERMWRLPRIAVSYQGNASLANDLWEPDPSGTVWLGSFNKFAKIREETLELWAGVLAVVPEAKLLLEDRGSHEQDSHQRIRAGLELRGIGAERVEFVPYVPGHDRHMLLYNRLDVALDTVPFNSGTTAFDALWMGVPLVALDGDWIGGRMSASVLRTLGRTDWIARTAEEYAGMVRDLARNVELRRRLRKAQRAEMAASPLMDARGLASGLQAALTGMHELWR